MILHTSCEKVGHRQAPIPSKTPQLPQLRGFCISSPKKEKTNQGKITLPRSSVVILNSLFVQILGDDMAEATFAGGCFWCLEVVFSQLRGVDTVTSGYCGGRNDNPTYEQVCSGVTGHAEAVKISFDPALISYWQLLEVFFATHDPTTLNRQGADVGTQYRSAIFFHSAEQEVEAQRMIDSLNAVFPCNTPVVTEVVEMPVFFPAESYHQNYFATNPGQGYCSFVIHPKLAKFRQTFSSLLKVSNPGQ